MTISLIDYKSAVGYLLVFMALTSVILPVPASASQDWQTHYTVNGFVNTGPPDPYQIFKVHYQVINGTLEDFRMPYVEYAHYMQANVTSNGNGVLEIRFPKNYPNANVDWGAGALFFVGQQEVIPDHDNADECFYEYSVSFTEDTVIDVVWGDYMTGEPFRGVDVSESCIPNTLVQDVVKTKDGIITPYQQMKAGVKLDEIVCELVVHPSGKIYCVTPPSAEILKQRWNIK
ncbi:hypothetical protein [Nitrososphaera sp.]|uniref:hypothetical protein n=1 Tax=Nitrososphaera sp. TaxID=1971748 RepID=UPI00317EDEA8